MDVYVARQPIFNRRREVCGYELLYRDSEKALTGIDNPDAATSNVITSSVIAMGLENLTEGKTAFINFTKNLITDLTPMVFSKDDVVIEILEGIEVDAALYEACVELKSRGYKIALDDFIIDDDYGDLLELADIVKVDFIYSDRSEREKIIELFKDRNVAFLAEKIENVEEYKEAVEMGFEYFQGYLFSKPVTMKSKTLNSYTINYFKLMDELNSDKPDFDKLTKIIETDLGITYKLLKLINSAAYRFNSRITSIKHALVLLGFKEVKKWVILIMMNDTRENDKPRELVRISLTRGKMCEHLAMACGFDEHREQAFLMGMLSMIDVIMERNMFEILGDLKLDSSIEDAILYGKSDFSQILKLSVFYEKGQWDKVNAIVKQMVVDNNNLSSIYFDSVKWVNETYELIG